VELVNGKLAPDARPEKASKLMLARYLQPDRLVPVTGLPATARGGGDQRRHTQLDKAHAIYEYVFRTMRYDKSGTGWGHGDTLWACDSKRGNCTDFHSVFLSMARSQQIPSRFEIGFPLPADKHCRRDPRLSLLGRVLRRPDGLDSRRHLGSVEAPEKHDYFFGAHDANRVQFSTAVT